jgi:two-component system sensor histidine kinase DegS
VRSARDFYSDDSATRQGDPGPSRVEPDQSTVLDFQERERSRIGFDLHDGPAQTLSAALLQLKMVEELKGDELHSGLVELRELMTKSLEETYELIEQLRTRALEEDSLKDKIDAYVCEFSARSGVKVTFAGEGPSVPLSPSLQIAIFRIVQEALSNVRRHACAENVEIVLCASSEMVTCSVVDDGCGFDTADVARSSGSRQCYGMLGMQERARFLDGECVVTSEPGVGTRVEVWIPVWRG